MRPTRRATPPRHLAGSPRAPWEPHLEADFDVAAALDEDADFDFEALFLGDDEPVDGPRHRARVARNKVAFAVSITLAALPFLVLDNFQATAESPDAAKVAATADAAKDARRDATTLPQRLVTTEVPQTSVPVTVGEATVFLAEPTTVTTEEPAPTTTTTKKAAKEPAKVEKPAPTTTTTARPTTTTAAPAAAASSSRPDPADPATWERLAKCESGGNWQAVSEPRNGMQYYGGLQFSLATWQGLGGTGLPSDAPKSTQIEMGRKLQARQGWDAWPSCARSFGWT